MPPRRAKVPTTTVIASADVPNGHSAADESADPPAASSSSRKSQFPPPQSSLDLNPHNALIFMVRGIYQYLSQFGFEDVAKSLRTEFGGRFDPNPLTDADEAESHLRCSMYRVFTLTAANTPRMYDSAVIVLDDINTLISLARMTRTIGGIGFELEMELRVQSTMSVFDDEHKDGLFDETLEMYFPPEVRLSQKEAEEVERKTQAGEPVTDEQLRRHQLHWQRLKLIEYQKNRIASLGNKKSTVVQHALAASHLFEQQHQRAAFQQQVRQFLKDILDKLQVQGAVFFEQMCKALMNRDLIIRPEGEEEGEEGEQAEDEDEQMKQEDEADEVEEEQPAAQEEEEQAAEEEPEERVVEEEEESPIEGKKGKKKGAKKQQEVPDEDTQSIRSKSSSKSKRGAKETPSSKAPVASILAAASTPAPAAAATTASSPPPSSSRTSRKRRSRDESKEPEAKEDEEEDVNVDEIEEDEKEEEVPVSPKRKPGRPSKQPKYDREKSTAQKIDFDEDAKVESEDEEEKEGGEGQEKESLPSFKKKQTSTQQRTPTSSAKKPAQLVPASADRGSQRGRPAVHRHAHDRAARRVPWTNEEIQKLTDGVLEFASERRKWSLILTKYNEFFQDRTVVDLKDKWRNLKGKVGRSGKSKADNSIAEDMEDIED